MTIRSRRQETSDTVTFELDASAAPVRFRPGQFTMLWRYGLGEVAISVSGDPREPERLVHTIRAVGAVTRPITQLRPGDVLGVRGPFGRPWPVDEAEGSDVVLVAGGLGMAPLRPAWLHLLANRERYGRVLLLVGARTPADLLFPDQLGAWRARFDTEVQVTVDRADAGWRGPIGVVTRLLERAGLDPARTRVMTCGPEVMMKFVAREALRQGIPADRIAVSMERNMQCAIGVCGHCQWGADFVCRDGPVFGWDRVGARFAVAGV
ncbi:MAG: FAD/NAD(P)-binding protein [Alphaproteobacteria bacterium]|nr:FAD/NAD(P)-binding protein [Alphaproteobacteria bacterium]